MWTKVITSSKLTEKKENFKKALIYLIVIDIFDGVSEEFKN